MILSANSCVLGNIKVGDRTVIGASAIVTKHVGADKTVVGLNKVVDKSMLPDEVLDSDTWQYEI